MDRVEIATYYQVNPKLLTCETVSSKPQSGRAFQTLKSIFEALQNPNCPPSRAREFVQKAEEIYGRCFDRTCCGISPFFFKWQEIRSLYGRIVQEGEHRRLPGASVEKDAIETYYEIFSTLSVEDLLKIKDQNVAVIAACRRVLIEKAEKFKLIQEGEEEEVRYQAAYKALSDLVVFVSNLKRETYLRAQLIFRHLGKHKREEWVQYPMLSEYLFQDDHEVEVEATLNSWATGEKLVEFVCQAAHLLEREGVWQFLLFLERQEKLDKNVCSMLLKRMIISFKCLSIEEREAVLKMVLTHRLFSEEEKAYFFFRTCASGSSQCIEKFQELGWGNKDLVDKKGAGLFHYALGYGANLEVLEYLKNLGLDINQKNKAGETPLFYLGRSSCSDQSEILKFLRANGADFQAVDNGGNTPLHAAAREAYGSRVIGLLIAFGVNPNQPNKRGKTPYKCCTRGENKKAFTLYKQFAEP